VPTGVAMPDARAQLFEAAERVLLRDGPSALTSRAVTTEAGCAKGVLHRHFADFNTFLVDLILDRVASVEDQASALIEAAGTNTVEENLTRALVSLFDPVAMAVVGLLISRNDLRSLIRKIRPRGVPVLGEGTAMITAYLANERELGRVDPGADLDVVSPTLIGAAHLVFTDRDAEADERAVERVVTTVMSGLVTGRDEAREVEHEGTIG
jgi:AcrR family transcriptional regulator